MRQRQHEMILKGTYILVMKIPRSDIEIGSLGMLHFSEGIYCYPGSAMNGLDQRIGRHMLTEKKMRWHIDRLTSISTEITAYCTTDAELSECRLAKLICECGGVPAVKGFGCSDCKCNTHLFELNDDAIDKLCSDGRLTLHSQRNGCN